MIRTLQFTALFLTFSFLATAVAQEDVETQQSTDQVSSESRPSETASLEFLNSGAVPTSVSQLRAMEEHVAELTEKTIPATVNIQVGQAQGTGVVVSRDGYILTAAHVIGGPGRPARITFPDGKRVAATTLGVNRRFDSGMLKIDDKGRWPYLDIGESELVEDGQWVIAIGHPGGIDPDRGLVLRVGRKLYGDSSVLNTDCTLVGGDSGGPLIDMDGNVIGIHSRIGGRLTDNIHVPIDAFSRDWDQLSAGTRVGEKPRPMLGLGVKEDSNVIDSISDDGPADKAGLKVGDKIIKLGDADIENSDSIRIQLFRKIQPGDKIDVVVERDDKEMSFELTVGERWSQ